MFQFFINPWLLLSLTGISLPIVAHFLSRRSFDVVEWAAMQFLNPSKKTRRRLKLEEFLLLLLRIVLIALIALSVTRPWIPGGWLNGYYSAGSRTIVVVIDGSNSMSRADGVNSMHQNAMRRASEFLRTLRADDKVALIDARDEPRAVIESPLSDLAIVEREIRRLPPPGGACRMLSAIEKAVAILGRSSASAREVVVFTDRQSNSWQSGNEAVWRRFDDLIRFPSVRPHVWVIDVAPHPGSVTRNISVGQIELSREMTVPGFPLRLRVAIHNESSLEADVPLRLMLDGQALTGQSKNAVVPANGDAVVEFEHALATVGTHVLSVEAGASDDGISVDNISHAAIRVERSLDVLLVNGTPSAHPEDRDSFFAELAFAPQDGKPPWVNARRVDGAELTPADFQTASAAVFCNVFTLPPDVTLTLKEFVAAGNGLLITCGQNATSESFQACFGKSGLLPLLQILKTREAPPQSEQIVRVAPLSLQSGWLDRFHSDPARSFLDATFQAWCLTKTGNSAIHPQAADQGSTRETGPVQPPFENAVKNSDEAAAAATSVPLVLASLTTGDPLLLESRCGDGLVLTMTSALNRRWNDLATRSDFVPFLHEAVFYISSSRSHRNVSSGEPLIARPGLKTIPNVDADSDSSNEAAASPAEEFVTFKTPWGATFEVSVAAEASGLVKQPASDKAGLAVFRNTLAPGVYSMISSADPELNENNDHFVVNYDHMEDDLMPLTEDDRARLATNDRIRFTSSLEDLSKRMYGKETTTELWAVLLTLFTLFLILELHLTHRIIRKGCANKATAALPM